MTDNSTTPPDDGRTEPRPDSPLVICPKCGIPSYRCECVGADQSDNNSSTAAANELRREIAAATAFIAEMGNRPLSDFAKGGGSGFLLRCMRAALKAADSVEPMEPHAGEES